MFTKRQEAGRLEGFSCRSSL